MLITRFPGGQWWWGSQWKSFYPVCPMEIRLFNKDKSGNIGNTEFRQRQYSISPFYGRNHLKNSRYNLISSEASSIATLSSGRRRHKLRLRECFLTTKIKEKAQKRLARRKTCVRSGESAEQFWEMTKKENEWIEERLTRQRMRHGTWDN